VGEALAISLSPFQSLSAKLTVPPFQYPLGTYRLVSRNGRKLKLDISNEVDHFIYFRKRDTTFEKLTGEIRTAKTILDIGGNIGAFALLFEQLNPTATICTFEPHPVTFRRLADNLARNNSKVQAFNCGLGDKKTQLKLYEIDAHNTGMNKLFAEEQDHPFVEIGIERLDECWADRGQIDLIKIDVEGFELAVLRGAGQLLQKYFPLLIIEIDDNNLRSNGSSARELIRFLLDLGYDDIMTTDKGRAITPDIDFTNCHMDIVAGRVAATGNHEG